MSIKLTLLKSGETIISEMMLYVKNINDVAKKRAQINRLLYIRLNVDREEGLLSQLL